MMLEFSVAQKIKTNQLFILPRCFELFLEHKIVKKYTCRYIELYDIFLSFRAKEYILVYTVAAVAAEIFEQHVKIVYCKM
jgi:hypothetical protein